MVKLIKHSAGAALASQQPPYTGRSMGSTPLLPF